jgi:hypothetical protein
MTRRIAPLLTFVANIMVWTTLTAPPYSSQRLSPTSIASNTFMNIESSVHVLIKHGTLSIETEAENICGVVVSGNVRRHVEGLQQVQLQLPQDSPMQTKGKQKIRKHHSQNVIFSVGGDSCSWVLYSGEVMDFSAIEELSWDMVSLVVDSIKLIRFANEIGSKWQIRLTDKSDKTCKRVLSGCDMV